MHRIARVDVQVPRIGEAQLKATKDVFEANPVRKASEATPFKPTKLDTVSERLSVLLQVKDQVPNIFKDAANYDIDLFKLLEEQNTLVARLVAQPGYSEAMSARKLVSMEIKPPAEGITVQAKTLKPGALSGWKASLSKALTDEQKQENLQKPPLEHIDSEIKRLLEVANPESTANDFLNPRNVLPKDATKKQKEDYKNAMAPLGNSPIREKLLKVKELFPEKSEAIDLAIAGLEIPETLGRLSELRLVLSGDPEPKTWEEAAKKIEDLSEEQLIYFDDKEDVLKQKTADHISKDQAGRITDLVFKRVHAFASQEESRAQRTTASVILREAPPVVAIFRGCIGGDCSSQFSFPYPNDPHERVFFIEDSEGKTKGYVSGTTVVKDGKKYLYLITVSGARVSAGDTELIFRGLYQQRALLGVEGILLPENSMLRSLVNYPQARGRYEAYARKGTPQAFSYQNPEIRKSIEDFSSDRNSGHYDHMSSNTRGVELSFNAKELKNLSSSVVHVPPASIDSQPIDSSSKEQILDFAINMHTSHREEMKTQLLNIPEVSKMISEESLNALLESAKAAQPGESLEQFKNRIVVTLKAILGDEARAKIFLEEHIQILFPAALLCSDAFEKANLEQTAEQVLKYALSGDLEEEFIVPGLEKITTTAAFAKWKGKAIEAFKQEETDEDFEETFLHVLKIGLIKDDELSKALWSLRTTYPKLILQNIKEKASEHIEDYADLLFKSTDSNILSAVTDVLKKNGQKFFETKTFLEWKSKAIEILKAENTDTKLEAEFLNVFKIIAEQKRELGLGPELTLALLGLRNTYPKLTTNTLFMLGLSKEILVQSESHRKDPEFRKKLFSNMQRADANLFSNTNNNFLEIAKLVVPLTTQEKYILFPLLKYVTGGTYIADIESMISRKLLEFFKPVDDEELRQKIIDLSSPYGDSLRESSHILATLELLDPIQASELEFLEKELQNSQHSISHAITLLAGLSLKNPNAISIRLQDKLVQFLVSKKNYRPSKDHQPLDSNTELNISNAILALKNCRNQDTRFGIALFNSGYYDARAQFEPDEKKLVDDYKLLQDTKEQNVALQYLKDSRAVIRFAAIEALGRLGGKEHLLWSLRTDPDETLAAAAVRAAGEQYQHECENILRDPNSKFQIALAAFELLLKYNPGSDEVLEAAGRSSEFFELAKPLFENNRQRPIWGQEVLQAKLNAIMADPNSPENMKSAVQQVLRSL